MAIQISNCQAGAGQLTAASSSMAALRSGGRVAGAEMWLLHWFSCCASEQPAAAQQRKQRQQRRRIDRSMIGEPTNFQHTGHIGSGEVAEARLQAVQRQMSSKGGYQAAPGAPPPSPPHLAHTHAFSL